MGTRCYIGKLEKDGSIKAIYCHHDGYVDGVGKTLKDFYDGRNIDQLLELGNLSSLGNNPVSSPRLWDHTSGSILDQLSGEYCVAYKDRGDEDTEAKTFENIDDYEKIFSDNIGIEYLYLLEGDDWFVSEGDRFEKF